MESDSAAEIVSEAIQTEPAEVSGNTVLLKLLVSCSMISSVTFER